MTKTEDIFKTNSPYRNPYQGTDKRVLFVCSAGLLRSATGARLYAREYNTRAAGSEPYALVPVTADLMEWADEIVFVQEDNYKSVLNKFGADYMDRHNIRVLKIPDNYEHMHPELIKHFEEQYGPC